MLLCTSYKLSKAANLLLNPDASPAAQQRRPAEHV
jgi:hypothetical protein